MQPSTAFIGDRPPREELRAVRHVLWEAHARARALVHELELEEVSPGVRPLCDNARRLQADIERTLLLCEFTA